MEDAWKIFSLTGISGHPERRGIMEEEMSSGEREPAVE